MSTQYFGHPFVSNSDLTALQCELQGQSQGDLSEAFRFGTLVHALILEPHKVDLILRAVDGEQYSLQEIHIARLMRMSFYNDAFCRDLLAKSETEVEMYNEGTRFHYNNISFALNTRRKYDGWIRPVNWGWDLKSTTATSQNQFEASVRQFHYDRARVFYSKGPGALQDVIIGISKSAPYKIFKVFLRHGDALWQEGERKCAELAFKYWTLKQEVVL
jgi:hypothetical protein